jgi:FkbH-like protein
LGIEDSAVELGMFEAIERVNRGVLDGVRSLPRVRVLTLSKVASTVGAAAFDEVVGSMTGQYFSGAMFTAISGEIVRHVSAMWAKRRSVLIVEPEGLFWKQGGADNGASGLSLHSDSRDRVYIQFQQACADLAARGVKLAMISRVGREDVEDIFNNHPDMILRTKDFEAMEFSWSDKPSLIRAVSERMNTEIGDVIYADASLEDAGWVSRNLKEIKVFSPSHVAKAASELRAVSSLEGDSLFALCEPPAPYSAWADSNSRSVVDEVHGYLESLETKVVIGESLRSEMTSVVASVQRAGAVDLTGNRMDVEMISRASEHPNARLFWIRVEDRFGVDGLAGVALVHCGEISWTLHGLLLSDSVLDRGVDASVISSVAEIARENMADEMFVQCAESGRGAAFSGIGLDEVGYGSDGGIRFRAKLVGEDATNIWRPNYVQCTTIVDASSAAVAA